MSTSVDPKLRRAFGTALRALRDAVDLTQEELLDKIVELGLKAPNRTTVSPLENGLQEPGLEILFKLARGVGIRPSEFVRVVEEAYLPTSELQRLDGSSVAKTGIPRLIYGRKRLSNPPQAK
jgi:transcriptional regulator with XRE-family HTH domain